MVWSGENVHLFIKPGTRVTVGNTVVKYRNGCYLSWSRATEFNRPKA